MVAGTGSIRSINYNIRACVQAQGVSGIGGELSTRHLVELVLLGTIWGSSYLFIDVALDGIDPLTLVAIRLIVGAATLLLVVKARGLRLPSSRTVWGHAVFMSIFSNLIPFTLIAWGQQHISSGLASILSATTPFFTLLVVVFLFQAESISATKVLGLLIGFAGVAALTGSDIFQIGQASTQGQIALLLASASYGVGFGYARRFARGQPLVLSATQLLMSAIIILPIAGFFGDAGSTELTLERVAAALALGALSSGFAYIIYYNLIAQIGATAASFSTYLIPLVGLFWGWLLLDEQVGVTEIIGVVLILSGLAVATGGIRSLHRRLRVAQGSASR